MPYGARFSRVFVKKEERLPSDVKSRVVEALREKEVKLVREKLKD